MNFQWKNEVVKVSISLPVEDIDFLDEYAENEGLPSRSAALHKAVRLLREAELGAAYEEAFVSFEDDGDSAAWEVTMSDDLSGDVSR